MFNPFRVGETFTLIPRTYSGDKYVKSLQDLKLEEESKYFKELLF